MLRFRGLNLLFSLVLLFAAAPAFAAKMITLQLKTSGLTNPHIEFVLQKYGYKIAHKNSNAKKTEIVATTDRDSEIPVEMILDLGFHSTFIEIKEPSLKVEWVALQIYLDKSISREDYIDILSGIQKMGIHVANAKSQKDSHFFLKVPRDKMELLTETLRKNPAFDLYYVIGNSPSTEFFQDHSRHGVTTLDIDFMIPGTRDSILADIPPDIAAVSVFKYQSGEGLPPGGKTTIIMPRKYAYVGSIIRALEKYRGERLIKMYAGDDYYEAKGDDQVAYIIDPNSRRFALEPKPEKAFEIGSKIPDIEARIKHGETTRLATRDVTILMEGMLEMVRRAFTLPIEAYDYKSDRNKQGGFTQLILVEIPKESLTRAVLEQVLNSYYLYPLRNDGTVDRDREVLLEEAATCDSLLISDPKKP